MSLKEKVIDELNKAIGFHPVKEIKNREVRALITVIENIFNELAKEKNDINNRTDPE